MYPSLALRGQARNKAGEVMLMTRVMVFIDGSNLYHDLKNHYSRRVDVDFEKFCKSLCGEERVLVRGYYYIAMVDQGRESDAYRKQQRFLDHLRRVPDLEVRLGALVYRAPSAPPVEKGIDIRIATDMIVNAARGNYDVAILVSGDTDFVDAIQAVKDFGRKSEIALFGPPTSSRKLRDTADRVISLAPPYFDDLRIELH